MVKSILTINGNSEVLSMNIGQKIEILFQRSGFKNYKEWGEAIGLSGDWLLDMKKKDTIKTVDITRLITIVDYHQVTLDWLFKDEDDNYVIDIENNLTDNDISKLLSDIQTELQKDEAKFNNYPLSKESKQLAFDAIDVLKGLIKSNL
jgi:hypothetical protein